MPLTPNHLNSFANIIHVHNERLYQYCLLVHPAYIFPWYYNVKGDQGQAFEGGATWGTQFNIIKEKPLSLCQNIHFIQKTQHCYTWFTAHKNLFTMELTINIQMLSILASKYNSKLISKLFIEQMIWFVAATFKLEIEYSRAYKSLHVNTAVCITLYTWWFMYMYNQFNTHDDHFWFKYLGPNHNMILKCKQRLVRPDNQFKK